MKTLNILSSAAELKRRHGGYRYRNGGIKKLKKDNKKNHESKLIISHEPDPSFEDDFLDFIQTILDWEEVKD